MLRLFSFFFFLDFFFAHARGGPTLFFCRCFLLTYTVHTNNIISSFKTTQPDIKNEKTSNAYIYFQISMASEELNDEQLRSIYAWIDAIPLSRPKRNIARDFSDGVLLAEIVAAYFPDLVELHNYTPANSTKQKVYNLEALNNRVLRKIGYQLTRTQIEDIVNCRTGAIEYVLNTLQFKMARYREKMSQRGGRSSTPNSRGGGRSPQAEAVTPAPEPVQAPRARQSEQKKPVQQNAAGGAIPGGSKSVQAAVKDELLVEKEQQIRELQETVEILTLKISKLEQLVRLKDNKIQKLTQQQT